MQKKIVRLVWIFVFILNANESPNFSLQIQLEPTTQKGAILTIKNKLKKINFDPEFNLTHIGLISMLDKKVYLLSSGRFRESNSVDIILKNTSRKYTLDLKSILDYAQALNGKMLKGKYKVYLLFFIDNETYATNEILFDM